MLICWAPIYLYTEETEASLPIGVHRAESCAMLVSVGRGSRGRRGWLSDLDLGPSRCWKERKIMDGIQDHVQGGRSVNLEAVSA